MHKFSGQAGVAAGILAVVVAVVAVANIANFQFSGQQVAQPNLIAHWKLDESSGATATDSSATGLFSGTLSSGVKRIDGKFGKAVSFPEGEFNYVEIGKEFTDILKSNTFTTSMWVRLPSDGKLWTQIFGGKVGKNAFVAEFTLKRENLYLHWYGFDTDGNGPSAAGQYFYPASFIPADQWVHIATAWWLENGLLKRQAYLNGVAMSPSPIQTYETPGQLVTTAPAYMVLGSTSYGKPSSGEYTSKADIDDVKVYNKALSATEVGDLYKETPSTPTPSATATATAGPSPSASTTTLSTPTLPSPIVIQATPTSESTATPTPTAQKFTITATTPADYKYKIHATQGSDNAWAKIVVRHPDGTEAGSASINKGQSKDFTGLGFSVKVLAVRATPKNEISGVDVQISSIVPWLIRSSPSPIASPPSTSTIEPTATAASTPTQTATSTPSVAPKPGTPTPTATAKPTTEPIPDPYASWLLDETSGIEAKDSSVNGYTGSIKPTNQGVYPRWTTGKYGNALKFAGSQRIEINPMAELASPITFEFWATSGSYGTVFGKAGGGASSGEIGYMGYDINLGSGSLTIKAQSSPYNDQTTLSANFPVSDGWNHYIVVLDPSTASDFKTKSQLYVNGNSIKLAAKDTFGAGFKGKTYTYLPLLIGAVGYAGQYSNYFMGDLDQLKIYSSALTKGQSKQLYIGSTPSSASGAIIGISGKQIAATLLQGLVAHWKFDDSQDLGKDSSANANDGQVNGNPVWVVGGKVGGALTFDGTDDYIRVPNSKSLNPKSITVSLWVKPDPSMEDMKLTRPYHVVAKRAGGANGFYLGIDSGKQTEFYTFSQSGQGYVTSGITFGEWHLLTGTLNADTGTLSFYRDGLHVGTKTGVVMDLNNIDLVLGIQGPDYTTPPLFKGLMDEVQIYDRALTAEEVKQLYNPSATPTPTPTTTLTPTPTTTTEPTPPPADTITITPKTPAEYSYKIYAPKGVNDVKAAIDIREPKGNLVESTSIGKGDTKEFPNIGFLVKVVDVRANLDQTVEGVDIELAPLAAQPPPTPTPEASPTPTVEPTISIIPVGKPLEFGEYTIHLAKPFGYQQYVEIYAEDKKGVRVAGQIFFGSTPTGITYSFVNKAGFILELLETNKFLGFGDLESVKVKITPVPKGTKYGRIGEARGYPSNPLDFGAYKIYSDKGVSGKWASIYIKDAQGIFVLKPTQVNKDEETQTQLEADGFKFKIKVLKVIANDDGTLSGPSAVELLVTPVGEAPLLPIPKAKIPKSRLPASTALVTDKQPHYFAGYKLGVGGPGVSRGGVGSGYVDLGLDYPDGRSASIVVKESEPNYDFLYEGFILNALSVSASERGPNIPVIDTSAYVYISPYPSKTKFLTLIPGEETALGDYKVYSEVIDPLTAKITFRDKDSNDLITQTAPIGEIRYWTGYIDAGQDIAIEPAYIAKVEDIRIDPNTGKPVGIEIAFIPARGYIVKPETVSGTLGKDKTVSIGDYYRISSGAVQAAPNKNIWVIVQSSEGSYITGKYLKEGETVDLQYSGLKVTAQKLEIKADIEILSGVSSINLSTPATFGDYKIYWSSFSPEVGLRLYTIDKNGKQSDPKLIKKGSVSYDFASAGFAIELVDLNTNFLEALVKITALSSPTDTSIPATTAIQGTLGMDNYIQSGQYKIYLSYAYDDNTAYIDIKNDKGEKVAEGYVYKDKDTLSKDQGISIRLKDVKATADIVAETYIPSTPTPPPKASPTPLPPDSEYAKIGPTAIYAIPRENAKLAIYTEKYAQGQWADIIVKDTKTGEKINGGRLYEGTDPWIFYEKGYKFSVKVVYVPQSSGEGLQPQVGQGIVDVLVTILERPPEETGTPSPGVYADISETDVYTFHPGNYKIYSSPYNQEGERYEGQIVSINIDTGNGKILKRQKYMYENSYIDLPLHGFRVTVIEIKKDRKDGGAKILVSPITKVDAPTIYIQPQQCSLLIENGKPADKLDLVVLGDGDWEDEEFERSVRRVVNFEAREESGVFYAEPLQSLKAKFNVWGYNTQTTFLSPDDVTYTVNGKNTIKWSRNCPQADAVLVLSKQASNYPNIKGYLAGYSIRGSIGNNVGFIFIPENKVIQKSMEGAVVIIDQFGDITHVKQSVPSLVGTYIDDIGYVSANTAAHELGHSLFDLDHDFTKPNTMGYFPDTGGDNWLPYQAEQIKNVLSEFKADNAGA